MEKAKKNLKTISNCILILLVLTFVRLVLELIYVGVKGDIDASKGVKIAELIIVAVLGFIILLPQLYVGIKGLKVAKNPDGSKAHIIWAIILLAISVISVIVCVVDLVKAKDIALNITELADCVLDASIFFLYILYAKEVKKNA